MVTRTEWSAREPKEYLTDLELPSVRVIIAHTATENCTGQASCIFHMGVIQNFHMDSRNWSDIGYNFLVGGDGNAYEGRGWDKQGAHTKGYNTKSICIAFIGTFNSYLPPKRQINTAKKLIAVGVQLKKLDPNYKLYGHRQLFPGESPGAVFYEDIKHWPHWTNTID